MNKFKLDSVVLISKPEIAALFSGCDVWLIPVNREGKPNFEAVYMGDDWYIQNEVINGYHDEECIIGVPLIKAISQFVDKIYKQHFLKE